jgi:hypothetical protein
MIKPDILSIARQQLFDAISNFQTPTCDPLNVSPWVAATRDHRGWRLRIVPSRGVTGSSTNKGVRAKTACIPEFREPWPERSHKSFQISVNDR